MIKLEMIGNLGADAKLITTEKNSFISFNLAETNADTPQWVECTKTVKVKEGESPKLLEHLKKGTKVYVTGRPHAKGYQDKGTLCLYIDELELL